MHKFLLHTLPLILLCLSSHAQPNPINRRAMAIAGLAQGPDLFAGLVISNRWMSTHFCTNEFVSDWIDETNAFHWVQDTGSLPLTNSTHGVWLDQNHFLLATNTETDQLVCFFIIDWMDGSATANNDCLFQDTGFGLGYGIEGNASGSGNLPQITFNAPVTPQIQIPNFPTNSEVNLIYTGGTGGHVYTNGVDAGAGNAQGWLLQSPTRIGCSSAGANGFHGFLKEFIVFTNKSITSGQISNLNYYAQNYPYIPSTGCAVPDLTAVAYRWVSADLPTGAVDNWADEIQGVLLKKYDTPYFPTNYLPVNDQSWYPTNGVHFGPSVELLTNAPLTIQSNVSFGFILNVIDPTGGSSIHPALIGNNDNHGADNSENLLFDFDQASSYQLSWQAHASFNHLIPTTNNKFSETNHIVDLIFTQSITNAPGTLGALDCYTNTIKASGISGSFGSGGSFWYWGATSVDVGHYPVTWPNVLGDNFSRGASPKFYLFEYWIWTNNAAQLLPATLITNFHTYATNRYKFTP